MINQPSKRVQMIKPSPTLAVTSKVIQLRSEGKDIVALGSGEPDFNTPEHIQQAGLKAIKDGRTKYTAVDGIAELKSAIIDKFLRDNNLKYQPEQILVSNGGKQSFFNLSLALLNPKDEVIIPAPYWVSYPDMVLIAEAKPVIIPTNIDSCFKINASQLQAAITEKTKLVVLNSPSNPSGASYSKQELIELADVLKQHPHVYIATDDMYEHILWTDSPFYNILMVAPELYDRCIVLNGVSKAYAMTGWRIGYCGGPSWLIKSMKKVQSQSTSNPCSVSQVAAVEALNGSQDCVREMVKAFRYRHDLVFDRLLKIPGVNVMKSDGTFYTFPDFSGVIKRLNLNDDIQLTELLLDHGVALVPGSAFGVSGCLRLSYATSESLLQVALDRMTQALT